MYLKFFILLLADFILLLADFTLLLADFILLWRQLVLCHVIDSCKIFGSTQWVRPNKNKTNLKELGQMNIKPTLVGFSGE